MRALEMLIWMVLLLMTPPLLGAMQIMPLSVGTCNAVQCGDAQNFIYNTMNSTSLQQVTLNPNTLISWDTVTFGIAYAAFGFFWILFLLSAVVTVAPALIIMFNIPAPIALYLTIGQWIIYMIAYIQIKRGGVSLDGYR
jgi:hypothetical protein